MCCMELSGYTSSVNNFSGSRCVHFWLMGLIACAVWTESSPMVAVQQWQQLQWIKSSRLVGWGKRHTYVVESPNRLDIHMTDTLYAAYHHHPTQRSWLKKAEVFLFFCRKIDECVCQSYLHVFGCIFLRAVCFPFCILYCLIIRLMNWCEIEHAASMAD